ncbi:MAG: phosphotransferase [bacterium]|nr:phosphotransferase [bacterium]
MLARSHTVRDDRRRQTRGLQGVRARLAGGRRTRGGARPAFRRPRGRRLRRRTNRPRFRPPRCWPVARTLQAMHERTAPEAPAGFCHGDIKPGNLLVTADTTIVLDLEHTRPISLAAPGATSGYDDEPFGTAGFAAPEVRSHGLATTAADVFGLGATLRWLLSGGGLARLPQDAAMQQLVARCTAPDRSQRPTAGEVATELASLARRLADEPDEDILARIASGNRIEFVSDSPRYAALQRFAQRQRRLLQRFPELLTIPTSTPSTPATVLRSLHHVQRTLRHFPRHRELLAWRRRLAAVARDLLAATASKISGWQRDEDHDQAARWLEDSMQLARALLLLPGRQPIPGAPDPRTAGLLQRDPITFLQRLEEQLGEARAELDEARTAIDRAEQSLDLEAAEAAIDAMAERYGGSSPTAARRRDQLHRLAFYFDRIALAQPNVDRLARTWDKTALEPVATFIGACVRTTARMAARTGQGESSTPLGLRSLQVTLVNLAEEFPHLYVCSGPAHEALSGALAHTSDLAAELVAEASQQLESVPVPVRPLQITLGRLDTFRILEALIDRPERPRSELLDSIEALRLKFETARAARDRLAEGAEEAIARGHWTTGLFDMERAVAGLNPADEEERAEAERLEGRLLDARKKKRQLEDAVRQNVELGNRYGAQQDDTTSTIADRIATLTERRTCLEFLVANLPEERARLYGTDLRDVELHIALEQAAVAEAEFDAATGAVEHQQEIAQRAVTELEDSLDTAGFTAEPPGRLVRMLEHWRAVVAAGERDAASRREEAARRARGRRRMAIAVTLSLGIAVAAVIWSTGAGLWQTAAAAERDAGALLTDFEARIAADESTWSEADRELVAALRGAIANARTAAPFDAAIWHDELAGQLRAIASHANVKGICEAASAGWAAALATAAERSDAAARQTLATRTRELAVDLADRPLTPPTAVLRTLR